MQGLTGEVPSRQLLPAMAWLAHVWPRNGERGTRLREAVRGPDLPRGVRAPRLPSWETIVHDVGRSRPDAVIMLLVGEDAVLFNRAFAAAGLDARCLRLSALIDESTLAVSGAESTRGICAAAAYFETLATPESLDFGLRYTRHFGPRPRR